MKSIRAVTKPGENNNTEKRYRSIRRLKPSNKKLKIKHFHHSSPYHASDHKAAVTVGVIMGFVPFFLSLFDYLDNRTYPIILNLKPKKERMCID